MHLTFKHRTASFWTASLAAMAIALPAAGDEPQYVQYEGADGPGQGKHIVLVSGDEEYRSEELLPQFGKILAQHHGFKTTVLFAINPDTGYIDPDHQANIPGLEHLEDADLMVIATRFRNPPEEQMQYIDNFINAGKPVIGLRTATHAFNFSGGPYDHYSFNHGGDDWSGGFGRQVLGETWVTHHGRNSHEATRTRAADGVEDHPILSGVDPDSVFCTTNVYRISDDAMNEFQTLLHGLVLTGKDMDDPAVEDERNEPPMPVAWLNEYTSPDGTTGQAFTTTMGTAEGFKQSEHQRRLLVNAAFHLLDLDVPEAADVEIIGEFQATPYGFGGFQSEMRPADFALE